ncbi:MAG: amidohydrolase family protein [Pseudomonadota bacterium]
MRFGKFSARIGLALFAVCVTACAGMGEQPQPVSEGTGKAMIVFQNVRALTMTDANALEGATVVVEDGRIAAVGEDVPIPVGARVIDGAGKTLMPGLADMHVHYFSNAEGPLYLANSITTVRNPWGTTQTATLDARAKAGLDMAPHIYYSGPLMDGPEPIWGAGSVRITSVEEVEGAIEVQRAAGFKAVKLYEGLTPEIFKAAVAAAKAADMQVWTHTPGGMTYADVITLGVDSIEHMNDMAPLLAPDGAALPSGPGSWFATWAMADPDKMKSMAERVAAAGVWNAPTFAVIANRYEYGADPDAFYQRPDFAYIGPGIAAWWGSSADRIGAYTDVRRDAAAKQRDMIKALYDAGAGLLIVTDTPNPFVIPGFAIHDELTAFIDAGVPVADVLKIATADAARFLGEEGEWGVIATGARADLVLLDTDPIADVSTLKDPAGVMVNGHWRDRAALQEALAQIRDDNERQRAEAEAKQDQQTN